MDLPPEEIDGTALCNKVISSLKDEHPPMPLQSDTPVVNSKPQRKSQGPQIRYNSPLKKRKQASASLVVRQHFPETWLWQTASVSYASPLHLKFTCSSLLHFHLPFTIPSTPNRIFSIAFTYKVISRCFKFGTTSFQRIF